MKTPRRILLISVRERRETVRILMTGTTAKSKISDTRPEITVETFPQSGIRLKTAVEALPQSEMQLETAVETLPQSGM